jgi:hypothetical protein
VVIDAGVATALTLVTVGAGAVTVMFVELDMFVYPAWVELAVQVPVPTPDGVKTPAEVIVPPVAVQLTAELYAPVPATVAAQVVVCPVVMDAGVATTATFVTVLTGAAAVTVIFAEPDVSEYPVWAELAVQVPVPTAVGVNTPPDVMVPPLAVHVTAELYAPVPVTFAVHVAVCPIERELGVAETATLVTMG